MKNIFTSVALLALASPAFAQITISSTDIPVPTTGNYVDLTSTAAPNPTPSAGGSWDYSAYTSTTTLSNVYTPETLSYFTAAGANVNIQAFKSLTPLLGYNVYSELAFTTSNVKEIGINVPAQGYSLAAFTTVATDSIVIPAQQILLTSPKILMQFPMTAGTSWNTVTRRSVNFDLTVSAASLSHTPSTHVFYIHRSDTIAGWGTMRVHTASGPSMLYNVLVDKVAQFAIDSFYVAGSPAATALLSGFGMAQGQTTDTNYRYNFYRKGTYNYLLSFYYGGDNTYSNPRNKYQNTDNITTANAAVNGPANETYTSVLFPNPATGSTINLAFSGSQVHPANYVITDMAGRAVQTGSLTQSQNILTILLDHTIVNGNYIINISDDQNKNIVAEQFTVSR